MPSAYIVAGLLALEESRKKIAVHTHDARKPPVVKPEVQIERVVKKYIHHHHHSSSSPVNSALPIAAFVVAETALINSL